MHINVHLSFIVSIVWMGCPGLQVPGGFMRSTHQTPLVGWVALDMVAFAILMPLVVSMVIAIVVRVWNSLPFEASQIRLTNILILTE